MQAIVIARMQADRRFVEDVKHADEPAADLSGQANALRFAARERRRGAVERQVIEADVRQEAEPAANFFEHLGRDRLPHRVEVELLEVVDGVGDAEMADVGQAEVRYRRRTSRSSSRFALPRACGFSRAP